MELFAIFGLCVATVWVVVRGHKKAVAASEAAMRAKLDSEGESSDATRALLREAGYNV